MQQKIQMQLDSADFFSVLGNSAWHELYYLCGNPDNIIDKINALNIDTNINYQAILQIIENDSLTAELYRDIVKKIEEKLIENTDIFVGVETKNDLPVDGLEIKLLLCY